MQVNPAFVPEPRVHTEQPAVYPSLDTNEVINGGPPHIVVQPGISAPPGTVVVPLPTPIEGVPPGLEYLTMVDTVYIQQMYELIEIISNWEAKNKYALKNANGQQIYYAAEESGCCERQCCGPRRGFTLHIVDNFKREVLTVTRPFKCCGGCISCLACVGCCAHECTIESPPGTVIGSVIQRSTICSPGFYIKDHKGDTVFSIDGPCCCLFCTCADKEFPVKNANGEDIGMVTKKWAGCLREAFTNADLFCISFPQNLDVKMKAILLGAAFLIDFMEFENPKNSNQ